MEFCALRKTPEAIAACGNCSASLSNGSASRFFSLLYILSIYLFFILSPQSGIVLGRQSTALGRHCAPDEFTI
jgi:hypothetical protein